MHSEKPTDDSSHRDPDLPVRTNLGLHFHFGTKRDNIYEQRIQNVNTPSRLDLLPNRLSLNVCAKPSRLCPLY
jgi:hypothetical protein